MSVKAKVGDTVIVTLSGVKSTGELCIVIKPLYRPHPVIHVSECVWVKRKDGTEGEFWLLHTSYEIIEETETEIAKPGDIVLVTNKNYEFLVGCEFIVVESNKKLPYKIKDKSEIVWINRKYDIDGLTAWLRHGDYEIVKRATLTPLVSCPDCNDTGTIELFTSTVKCGCKK